MDTTTTSQSPSPAAPGALRAIWQRRRDDVLARVDVVDEAIAAMLGKVLGDDLRAAPTHHGRPVLR